MKLPTPIAYVLAIAAGVLEVVQQYAIPASSTVHSVIAFSLLVVVGLGVVPVGAKALGRLIPLHFAAGLTALAGILQVVQQNNLNVSPAIHSIIAVGLLLLAAVGIVPHAATPTSPSVSSGRPSGSG